MSHSLNIVYFAWVRERLGRSDDQITVPENISTVTELLLDLSGNDIQFSEVFSDIDKLRFALDQRFVKPDAQIGTAKELAIFPPVTGG